MLEHIIQLLLIKQVLHCTAVSQGNITINSNNNKTMN